MLDVKDYMEKQIIVIFSIEGEKICISNDNIVIKDKDEKIKLQCTCYRIASLFVIGNASITTVLINNAKKFGFVIVLFSSSFKVYEVMGFAREANTLLHLKQYNYFSLDIAKHITINKIKNQLFLLKEKRDKTVIVNESIRLISLYIEKIPVTKDLHELMAYEGLSSKEFFKSYFIKYDWKGRFPRAKIDYINTTLDIGYTVMFAFIEALLRIYGFDLYYGVMHKMFYMRKSLVCDIIEPFRSIIEKEVVKSINLGHFSKDDFFIKGNAFILDWKKSPKYVSTFLKTILEKKKEIFIYIRSYYRAFMKNVSIDKYPWFYIGEENGNN